MSYFGHQPLSVGSYATLTLEDGRTSLECHSNQEGRGQISKHVPRNLTKQDAKFEDTKV